MCYQRLNGGKNIMIEVHDIVFCLNATNEVGRGASAHQVFSTMNPEYIPGLFSFSTVITLLGIDSLREHKIMLTLKREDDQEVVVAKLEGMLPIIEELENLPDEIKGVNLAVGWNNINFTNEGMYRLSVFVDEMLIDGKSIYVKGKNQNG